MAFLVYGRRLNNGIEILKATGEHFSLAGYNLIYSAWERRGKPINQGWHVDATELADIYSGGKKSHEDVSFIIDFDPNATWRIGLIELLDIYVYTYEGNGANEVSWSPLMLRMRDVYYNDSFDQLTAVEKNNIISELTPQYGEDFIEFLYLNGSDKGWNWGRSGATNAVFLQGEAREYFRQFF
jgi:hypothetical protein